MRPTRVILALALGCCLVLCVGNVLAKNTRNVSPSVTRADVAERVVEGRAEGSIAVRKAAGMLEQAQTLVAEGQSAEAVGVLNKVVGMDLPANRPANKLVADAYKTLGDIYRAEAGGIKAISFYNLALQRLSPELDHDMITNVRGLVGGLQSANPAATITPSAPTILDAGDDTCDVAVPVTLPWTEIMSIYPAGDHNFRSFTTTANSTVHIETHSTDIYGDDTNLTLWGGCSGSTATDFLVFDDDGGDGFLSLIDSPCLPPGTYYVDVGGFADISTPDDFELEITETSTGCFIPAPDAYEPDDEIGAASKIGFRNNGVGEGNQYGRDNKNIQQHTIYPGLDIDFVKFGLSRANWVRLETSGDMNPDTIEGLSFPDGTLIAVNDDKAVGDFSSKIEACLPEGDWYGVVIGYSGVDTFNYDWAVDVEYPCLFEEEPNGAFATANAIEPGEPIYGIHTYAPVGDNDFFTFTLDAASLVTLETSGYDIYNVDTTLDLYDSNGVLLASDEDGGEGYLSKISTMLDPGTYYVNVWSYYGAPTFPYGLTLTLPAPPIPESEPNDSCGTANAVTVGDTVAAAISPAGDYDYFALTVPADGYVQMETTGISGDTVLNIYSADGSAFVGCDDDNGDGLFSLWSCCLPAGDYCVEVRAYSSSSTISAYNLEFSDLGTCTPGSPLTCPSTGLSCP